ncbi:hypothetical protein DSL72_001228 [Monilinia vaccinii-corymbosi]|uniref:Uncharacterized protein n=1 Tax=Monilinia vaccinii-corymbosi TaxID=61207 RepID=A0A8A3P7G9_9HELO|nr:hypothetical protein DSL72_001228 [Monilinia vaccinii-corymbosi]
MARQAEHAAKTKTSKVKVCKVSKVIPPPKNCREKTKKSEIVKPIAKNDVRKLQRVDKHAHSPQVSKHSHAVEPSPEPDNLASALKESLEGARTHIINAGYTAFDEAYTVLIQKLADQKAKDRSFLKNAVQDAQALGASLAAEQIEITVQRKNRPVTEVDEIGKRIDLFKQTIASEESKLEAYWKQYESLQADFLKFTAQVFSGDSIREHEEDEGYRNDMRLLDAEHADGMKVLLGEVDEVGHEAIKKMKASEKEIDIKADKVRQRIVGAMMW